MFGINKTPLWQTIVATAVAGFSTYNAIGGTIAKNQLRGLYANPITENIANSYEIKEAHISESEPIKLARVSKNIEQVLNEPIVRGPVFEVPEEIESARKYQLSHEDQTEQSVLRLADALYLEGRGVHSKRNVPDEKYLEMIGGSIIERTVKGWRKAKSIEDTLGKNKQYSFTNENNGQHKISTEVKNHARKNVIDWNAYQKCEEVARDLIYNGSDSDIDHFYVDRIDGDNGPKWANASVDKTFTHKSYFKAKDQKKGKVQKCVTRCYDFL